jgi:hypothetical protein
MSDPSSPPSAGSPELHARVKEAAAEFDRQLAARPLGRIPPPQELADRLAEAGEGAGEGTQHPEPASLDPAMARAYGQRLLAAAFEAKNVPEQRRLNVLAQSYFSRAVGAA